MKKIQKVSEHEYKGTSGLNEPYHAEWSKISCNQSTGEKYYLITNVKNWSVKMVVKLYRTR